MLFLYTYVCVLFFTNAATCRGRFHDLLDKVGNELVAETDEGMSAEPWQGPWRYLGKATDGKEVYMPYLGLGTWGYDSDRAYEAAKLALGLGYRHIDTAYGYNNQEGVGKAVRESGIPREYIFITSKIPGGLLLGEAIAALETNLDQLRMKYMDLVLLHFPCDENMKGGRKLRQDDWRALEKFYKEGKAKAIGVSHYCKRHVQDILEISTLPIAVNQVQYHVGMGMAGPNATDDKKYMEQQGILYQSFSPLCGPCGKGHDELIKGELVSEIGKKHNKTGAQVSLKWLIQHGIPVIPKSDNEEHLRNNLDIFDWQLGLVDMFKLDSATSPAVAGGFSGTSGDCDIP